MESFGGVFWKFFIAINKLTYSLISSYLLFRNVLFTIHQYHPHQGLDDGAHNILSGTVLNSVICILHSFSSNFPFIFFTERHIRQPQWPRFVEPGFRGTSGHGYETPGFLRTSGFPPYQVRHDVLTSRHFFGRCGSLGHINLQIIKPCKPDNSTIQGTLKNWTERFIWSRFFLKLTNSPLSCPTWCTHIPLFLWPLQQPRAHQCPDYQTM